MSGFERLRMKTAERFRGRPPLPKTVATRIEEEDFLKLVALGRARRLSVATLIRDAIAHYLANGAPPPDPLP